MKKMNENVDVEEEIQHVMGTHDGWLTLGSMSTHLKLATARLRSVDIDPREIHPSGAPTTYSLYKSRITNLDLSRMYWIKHGNQLCTSVRTREVSSANSSTHIASI